MANAFVQVPPQSTGLKLQTFENVVGANTVESEAVTLVRSSDNTEVGTSGQPLRVDVTGTTTQPVSGTVTVNGTVTTSPPTNASENLAQVAGTTLGATAVVNYGSTPAAAAVPAVNAFVTNTVAVSGTVSTTPPTNASENVAQFGGANVVTGTGIGGAGIPRVTVSNDSVVALSAGSAVIGHVIADTGSTTAVTGNVTAVQATGTNLHTVLDSGTLTAITNALPAGSNVIGHVIADTGSTTAVTGNVTVVQPTGTNLHAVLDSTSTTTVTQATGSNLHVVVDTAPTTSVTQGTSPWVVSGSGTFTTQDVADGTVGGATPTMGYNIAGTDPNGTLRGIAVDPKGQQIISASSGLNDLLYQLILETRATRMAIIALGNGGGSYNFSDFSTDNFQDQITN